MEGDNISKLPKSIQTVRQTHGNPIGRVIRSQSNTTELAMEDDLDDPLPRITTTRTKIIIYSTGKRFKHSI